MKYFKSQAASSQTIENNSLLCIIRYARLNEFIKINTFIDVGDPDPEVGEFNKTSCRWRQSVYDRKATIKPNPLHVCTRDNILLKDNEKLRDDFSLVVKIKKLTMFFETNTIFLKIFIQIVHLQRFIYRRQGASLLIMFDKIMNVLLPSCAAKIFTS